MKKSIICLTSVALVLGGCATASKDVAGTYVSPLQYQTHDCDQIAAETARLQGRVVQLGGRLDQAADNDKALVGVGMVLFWPALFFIGGTKAQEAEYARLKGENDALMQAAVVKKCGNAVSTAPAMKPAVAQQAVLTN